MRALLLLGGLLFAAPLYAQSNYVLTLDGEPFEVALDSTYTFETARGPIHVSIARKPILRYERDGVAFSYPSSLNPAETQVDADIRQVMLATARGSIVMMQSYGGMDPTLLVPLMLQELTKEQASFGYNIETEDISWKLVNGMRLDGQRAVSSGFGERQVVEVVAIGNTREGYLIATVLDDFSEEEDSKMLTLFRESLALELAPPPGR
jgi:hypothetical protein